MNITLDANVLAGLRALAERLREPFSADVRDLVVLCRLARWVPDLREYFPDGQHATLNAIEVQLDAWSRDLVEWRFRSREDRDLGGQPR